MQCNRISLQGYDALFLIRNQPDMLLEPLQNLVLRDGKRIAMG